MKISYLKNQLFRKGNFNQTEIQSKTFNKNIKLPEKLRERSASFAMWNASEIYTNERLMNEFGISKTTARRIKRQFIMVMYKRIGKIEKMDEIDREISHEIKLSEMDIDDMYTGPPIDKETEELFDAEHQYGKYKSDF